MTKEEKQQVLTNFVLQDTLRILWSLGFSPEDDEHPSYPYMGWEILWCGKTVAGGVSDTRGDAYEDIFYALQHEGYITENEQERKDRIATCEQHIALLDAYYEVLTNVLMESLLEGYPQFAALGDDFYAMVDDRKYYYQERIKRLEGVDL